MADDERDDPADDAPADEEQSDADADADAADEHDEDKPPKPKNKPKQRPERQAARYRVERNQARHERDEARLELLFTRAAGGRFVDPEAAFKLADRNLLSMDPDGVPVGLDESIEALAEANPFLLTSDDDGEEAAKPERDPFKTSSSSSGRTMNGKRKPLQTGLSRAALEAKYPALRRGR